MALLLRHDDVCASVSMQDAIAAMEDGFREEGEGQVLIPPRINMKAGNGWLRLGPAALERSGWIGFKAMNLSHGHGVRYQIHLYRTATGELLSIMDAQHLTTLRTGATSAVATRRLARKGGAVVALLGSGAEARAQLNAMQALGIVRSAKIFSRTEENRNRLAAEFRKRHDMDVVSVCSPEEAVVGSDIVLAAVKSSESVLRGEWLKPGMHINSVGTARREQRELDPVTFQRSDIIIVDTRDGVLGEAGDAVAAKDVLASKEIFQLSELVTERVQGRQSDSQITLFKSVGTGLQDIALAAVVYQRALERGLGTQLDHFPKIKG
jgi:alanine dehydrogenase